MAEARGKVPTLVVLGGAECAGAKLTEREDDELMLLSAGGSRDAFEALVARHLPRLTSYCAKFLGSARSGEEIAQDALLEVWVRRARYRPSGRFRVFLFTMTRNRCLNRLRHERRRQHDEEIVGIGAAGLAGAGDGPDQLDGLLEEERRRRVRVALLELAPKLREAALLRFDQELGYAEIARIVRRPEATVRSRVFLALRRLREAVAGDLES